VFAPLPYILLLTLLLKALRETLQLAPISKQKSRICTRQPDMDIYLEQIQSTRQGKLSSMFRLVVYKYERKSVLFSSHSHRLNHLQSNLFYLPSIGAFRPVVSSLWLYRQ